MKMISNLSNKHKEAIVPLKELYLFEDLEQLIKRHEEDMEKFWKILEGTKNWQEFLKKKISKPKAIILRDKMKFK